MTVREAFAAAGHPVPEGYELACSWHDDCWFARKGEDYVVFGPELEGVSIRVINAVGINLSNLPAIDAYDALPDVVKAVVPK